MRPEKRMRMERIKAAVASRNATAAVGRMVKNAAVDVAAANPSVCCYC